MKNLLVLCFVFLASCLAVSTAARQDALLPAVRLSWGTAEMGVQSDTLRGIADALEDGDLVDASALLGFADQLTDALAQGSVPAVQTVPWETLSAYATRGINDRVEDGEMVQQTATFLHRRLENFNKAMSALTTGVVAYRSTRSHSATASTPYGRVPLVAVVTH